MIFDKKSLMAVALAVCCMTSGAWAMEATIVEGAGEATVEGYYEGALAKVEEAAARAVAAAEAVDAVKAVDAVAEAREAAKKVEGEADRARAAEAVKNADARVVAVVRSVAKQAQRQQDELTEAEQRAEKAEQKLVEQQQNVELKLQQAKEAEKRLALAATQQEQQRAALVEQQAALVEQQAALVEQGKQALRNEQAEAAERAAEAAARAETERAARDKTKYLLIANLITSIFRAAALEANQHLGQRMGADSKTAIATGIAVDLTRIADDVFFLLNGCAVGCNNNISIASTAPWIGYDARNFWNKISKLIDSPKKKNIKALDSETKARVKKSAKQLAEMIKLTLPSIEAALVIARSSGALIYNSVKGSNYSDYPKKSKARDILRKLVAYSSVAVAVLRTIEVYLSSDEDESVRNLMVCTALGSIALGGILEFGVSYGKWARGETKPAA